MAESRAQAVSGVSRKDGLRSHFCGSAEARNREPSQEGSAVVLTMSEWHADRLGVVEGAGVKGQGHGSHRNQEVSFVWHTQEAGEGTLVLQIQAASKPQLCH